MLKNNNNAIIKTLAKKSLRNNRKKYGILFFTIILSSFLIFSIFTIGITYLDLSRLQNIRFNGADYDSVVINGFDSKQKEYLDNNEKVQSVGIQTYSGYIKSSNFDDTVDVGLLWCDDVFWQKQSAPARTMLKGHYPQKENELMVTREGLKKCGNEILDVGDSLTLTYEVNTGIYEKEFVISGIWDGFGDKSIFYVSKDFYNNSGYSLNSDGILHIKYQQNYFTNKIIQEVETGLDLNDRQVFQTTSLAENSFKILFGTLGLGLIVGLSAYLLIYNILYLSIYEKVRYYGLLQTLGMTKKQLIRLMKYQIALLALLAIIIGILSGIGVSIIILPKIMETLGGLDLESSRRVAGQGFYYLMGDVARLHSAVLTYARDFMINKGFTYCIPPFMIRSDVVTGVMSFEEMDAMMYKIEGEDLYLIGTSEHSMIGKFKDQILKKEDMPYTMTSYSPCFRKEKGAHGIEERGVYRIHQFEKQEMIVVCEPEDSWNWYEKMWSYTVEFFRSMNIPVRTLECCSGDLADLKAKSCDVEAWSPRQQKYFEVGSCSNLTDAQARRLGIRIKGEKGNYFAHTLNNTVVAPPRMLIAIMENNYQPDGSVIVPEVLRPYMGGLEKIEPKKK